MAGQTDAALANMRRAHELNPNDARALSFLGVAEANAGDPQKRLENARQALRLSPRDPWRHLMLHGVGFAHLAAKQYVEAIEWAQRSVVDAPKFPPAHLCLVLSWVGLAEIAKARAEFQVWRSLVPGQVEARLAGKWPTIPSPDNQGERRLSCASPPAWKTRVRRMHCGRQWRGRTCSVSRLPPKAAMEELICDCSVAGQES